MKKAFGFSIAATMGIGCLTMTPAANAGDQVLWDQQPDVAGPAFVDQNFSDFASFATFLVSDVVFGGAVQIHSITTYYTKGASKSDLWPADAFGTATLNIFADPLSNALHNPLLDGTSVEVFYAVTANGFAVTASGLNIDLGAGTYWVGLTPELGFVDFDQEFHQQALNPTGGPTMARNPGLGFAIGPDWVDAGLTFPKIPIEGWDAAITITGIPTPGALALLGVAGLATRRRRRR